MKCKIAGYLLAGYLLLTGLTTCFCQNISIQASVDKNTAAVNEQITLQVVVSGEVSNIPAPKLPPLEDFNVYSAGTSQNVSFINGKVSSALTYSYVIVPKKTGKLSIGPVVLEYNGQTFKSAPIEIEAGQSSQPQQQIPTKNESYQGKEKNIFIVTEVDKKNVYVNEQVTLTLKFFRRVELLSQPQYQPPSTPGFISEDLPPQRDYYTNIDGVKYLVTEIKTGLFPASTGKFNIGSAVLKCAIADGPGRGNDPFNDDFFKGFFQQGKNVSLQSDPIEIKVQNLPSEGKPADFTGAVGRYSISASADKTKAKTNDAVTLAINISGTGNIKSIPEPKVNIQNFKKYDTLNSLNIRKDNYIVQGTKSYKMIFIPQVQGRQVIPEINFNYFDPVEKTYKTARTKSIVIDVSQGPSGGAVSLPALSSGKEDNIKLGASDIRHIKTRLSGNGLYNSKGIFSSLILVILQFFPVFVPLSLWRYQTWKKELFRDTKRVRYTYAYKTARSRLKSFILHPASNGAGRIPLHGILKKKDTMAVKPWSFMKNAGSMEVERFANELSDILCRYFGDKFNLSQHGITLDRVIRELETKQISAARLGELKYIWEEINFIQFAPAKAGKEKITELYDKIINILEQLEKNI